jgi:tetraacyldisaccharide 4'-kinase
MRPPAFWWREPGVATAALWPFGVLYGAVAARRLSRQGYRADVPVICMGDFTLGGAGKTPAAIATAMLLRAAGEQPAFLTRGYGGRLTGPVQVDPTAHDAAQVGDEALLLARECSTIVAHDRVAGTKLARETGASVIVMDDGFHNGSLEKDCSIIVIDAARGIGNGRVFPAGPLRAPLSVQLQQAHALLKIGRGDAADQTFALASSQGLSTFTAQLEANSHAVAALRAGPVLAFAGIGNPAKFFSTLKALGIDARRCRAFPDHHRFTQEEAREIVREADAGGLSPLTTEKDFVRLSGDGALAALRARTKVLPVALRVENEPAFRRFLLSRIRKTA